MDLKEVAQAPFSKRLRSRGAVNGAPFIALMAAEMQASFSII
jgi:hypothetical protein